MRHAVRGNCKDPSDRRISIPIDNQLCAVYARGGRDFLFMSFIISSMACDRREGCYGHDVRSTGSEMATAYANEAIETSLEGGRNQLKKGVGSVNTE